MLVGLSCEVITWMCLRWINRVVRLAVILVCDQTGERKHVGLQGYHDAHQSREHNAVEEDVTQDFALMSVPLGSGAGDDDALRINHLAHHAATTVRGGHQGRGDSDLFG